MRRLLFVPLLLCASCAQRPTAPTLAEIEDSFYTPTNVGVAVQLHHGKWEGAKDEENPFGIESHLSTGIEALSDIDQDGLVDALTIMNESEGGSGIGRVLAVFNRVGDRVQSVATQQLGDRIQVRSIRTEPNRIIAVIVEQGEDEPLCCPTQIVEYTWNYNPGKFTQISKRSLGHTDPR